MGSILWSPLAYEETGFDSVGSICHERVESRDKSMILVLRCTFLWGSLGETTCEMVLIISCKYFIGYE